MITTRTPIRFKAITHRGKVVSKILKIDIPKDSEPMKYLDDIDKLNIMEDNDWGVILDYSIMIKKPKTQKITLKSLVEKYFENSKNKEKVVIDFMVVYSRMKNELDMIKPELQFRIILKAMGVGYDASSETYRYAIELIKSIGDEDIQKKLGFDKIKGGNK